MNGLLLLSRWIDTLNDRVGKLVYWCILVAVLISAGNAVMRYSFNMSSNAWLEIQWYLFAAVFLLCAGYTFLHNEHIRIDIVAGHLSHRAQTWIDVFGTVLFLLPMAILIMWLSLAVLRRILASAARCRRNAGGLIVWPVKLLVPVGFLLLTLQGVSELIKRIAFLHGAHPRPGRAT